MNESKHYAYDTHGRVIEEKTTLNGVDYAFSTVYDPVLGYVKQTHYPNNILNIENQYDSYGFLRKRIDMDDATVYWEAKSSNALGQINQVSLSNDMMLATSHYNSVTGRLHGISTGSYVGFDDIVSLSMQHDYAGNITQKTDNNLVDNVIPTETYSYDYLNRLTNVHTLYASGTATHVNLTYDYAGNMLSKSDVGGGTYRYGNQYNVENFCGATKTYCRCACL